MGRRYRSDGAVYLALVSYALGAALIVSYQSQADRALALDSAVAADRLGEPAAAWLHAMLAEVEAATDAAELLSLYGGSARVEDERLVVEVASGLAASFAAIGGRGVAGSDVKIDWGSVRRLKLVEVETDGSGG